MGKGATMRHHKTERSVQNTMFVAGFVAECVIGEWIGFYNTERPHSAHNGCTPA